MNRLRLIAITDPARWSGEEMVERFERIARLAEPGSVAVQLRGPFASDRAALWLGERLAEVARSHDQRFVVNDRLDLALLLGAHGVHLGERSVGTADARRLVGPLWISRARHDPGSEGGRERDADAVLLSPIVEARKGRAAWGIDALRMTPASNADEQSRTSISARRLFALGGVRAENAAACLAAGADGVAVVQAAWEGDPGALLHALGILAAGSR